MALKVTLNHLKPPQQRNTAQSCSGGFGSITGVMPTGRPGRLCQRSHRRVASLRPVQAVRHLVHMPRPATGNSLLTRETGTVTLIPSVSQHPHLIRLVPRPGRVQPRPRPQVLMRGQPSSRMGIHLRQVCLSLTAGCCKCCVQYCVLTLYQLGHGSGKKQA